MFIRVLRVLLGLGRVLLAFGVVIAMSLGGSAMGLRCGVVMLGCLVVFVFHVILLKLADRLRLATEATSIMAKQSVDLVLIEDGLSALQSKF